MAVAGGVGVIGGNGWFETKFNVNVNVRRSNRNNLVGNRVQFLCASSCSSSSVMDPYKTLRIHPGASESEVRKAFRQLALQYHPDVCRGSNCGVQFNLINEAYEIVMSNLRGGSVAADQMYEIYDGQQGTDDEGMRGMNDPDWDLWEEWMGWEGAGIRDYSSHINPYI